MSICLTTLFLAGHSGEAHLHGRHVGELAQLGVVAADDLGEHIVGVAVRPDHVQRDGERGVAVLRGLDGDLLDQPACGEGESESVESRRPAVYGGASPLAPAAPAGGGEGPSSGEAS